MSHLYERLKAIRERGGRKQDASVSSGKPVPQSSGKQAMEPEMAGQEARHKVEYSTPAPVFQSDKNGAWSCVAERVWTRTVCVESEFQGMCGIPHIVPADESVVYLDTETTGLSGGAGTYAFLVGWCRRVGSRQVEITQVFMEDFDAEPAMLDSIERHLIRDGAPVRLVTYNGSSFDLPLLRTRWIMNGREMFPVEHRDLLHRVRRYFKRLWGGCSLRNMESKVLGIERSDDVPGELIPGLYIDYVRNRQKGTFAEVLEGIFRHHAQDVLSLALLDMICSMPPDSRMMVPACMDRNGGLVTVPFPTDNAGSVPAELAGLMGRQNPKDRDPDLTVGRTHTPASFFFAESSDLCLLLPDVDLPIPIDAREWLGISEPHSMPAEPAILPHMRAPALPVPAKAIVMETVWSITGQPWWGFEYAAVLKRRAVRTMDPACWDAAASVYRELWESAGIPEAVRLLGSLYERVFRDIEGLTKLAEELANRVTRIGNKEKIQAELGRRILRLGRRVGDRPRAQKANESGESQV